MTNQKKTERKMTKKSGEEMFRLAANKVGVGLGLIVVFACVALGLLMGKQANAPIAIGKGANATARPVSSVAKDNGRSASAGDGGAATAGDGSPAVSVSGISNDVKVSVFNCENAFIIDGMVESSERLIGAFAHVKQLKEFEAFDKAIGVSAAPTMIGIEMMTDLIASTMKTKEAMDRRDRYEAVACAERTKCEAYRLMAYNVPFSDQAKQALADAAEGPCESAWFRRDYDGMGGYASRIVDACGFPPPIRALAYKRLVELLKLGCEFYEPSLDELMMLQEYGKEYAYNYLNLFAKWGYLRPRSVAGGESLLDYYKDYFGFVGELEYRQTVCFRRSDGRGGELVSHEISVLSLGLGSYRYFDLTDAYAKCCGRKRNPVPTLKVEFDTGMKFEEWEIAGALAKILLKVDPEVEERGWEEGYVVATTDAFKFLQTDVSAVCYNEEIAKHLKMYCMETQPVPEPTSAILFLVGVAGLALKRKRAKLIDRYMAGKGLQ